MIEAIAIRNFQSLRSIHISLGRFTVLVGESDLGKSAVIRAIHAAVTNQTGTGFISTDASFTSVTFVAEFDAVFQWRKAGSASYKVGAEQELYDKVRGVPPEVAAIHKLSPLQVGDNSVEPNFHLQFDTPFLVADTPALRARVLGELSGINLLFLATQEARRLEQAAARERSSILASIERNEQALKPLETLPDWAVALESAALLNGLCTVKRQRAGRIQQVVIQLSRSAREIQRLRKQRTVLLSALARLRSVAAERGAGDAAARLQLLAGCVERLRVRVALLAAERAALVERLAALRTQRDSLPVCPTCGQAIDPKEEE